MCKYIASKKYFCKIGSKRRLLGQNRKTYTNYMIDNGIAPSELRKDAARRIMKTGTYILYINIYCKHIQPYRGGLANFFGPGSMNQTGPFIGNVTLPLFP